VEGGGRQSRFDHNEFRYVIGLRGDINSDWKYDGYMQLGSTSLNQSANAYFLTPRLNRALIAVRNASGQIVCQSVVDGSDPNCVPYNIFSLGGVTQAALNYLQAPSFSTGNITQRVVNLAINGQLPEGVGSPFAQDRIGVAFGAEYRREHLESVSDSAQAAGQLNGAGGAALPVNGGYDVYEAFAEARVPLVQDMPFAKDLALELGYRYSDYSTAVTTNTFKVLGDWTIAEGYRVRGGFNRAVRAANIVELFSPRNAVLDGTVDPCAGLKAGDALVARCSTLFGLTTAQVLALEPDPAQQYYGLTGGNPGLTPEKADTWTLGFVANPEFAPGLNISVDWFDIDVKDYIAGIGADTIIQGCIIGGKTDYCPLVKRDAIGSIRSPLGYVIDTQFNTGGLHTSGVDLTVNYRSDLDRFGIENMGSLALQFNGTYLDKLEVTPLKGDKPSDCAGYYGTLCSSSLGGSSSTNPVWRHKARLTWNTPFEAGDWAKSVAVSMQWRHFDSSKRDSTKTSDPRLAAAGPTPGTDAKIPSQDYIDLTMNWTIKDQFNFRMGMNNVFDRDPPLIGQSTCPSGPCNGNTYPQTYDALGRYLFVGLSADF